MISFHYFEVFKWDLASAFSFLELSAHILDIFQADYNNIIKPNIIWYCIIFNNNFNWHLFMSNTELVLNLVSFSLFARPWEDKGNYWWFLFQSTCFYALLIVRIMKWNIISSNLIDVVVCYIDRSFRFMTSCLIILKALLRSSSNMNCSNDISTETYEK